MAVEDRTGVCATCHGPIYRQPVGVPGAPDRWFHRRAADWIDDPHDPAPAADGGAS